MRHLTNSEQQTFVPARPSWVTDHRLTKERGEKTWQHLCQKAGRVVLTASQMGLRRNGSLQPNEIHGCPWCSLLPASRLRAD